MKRAMHLGHLYSAQPVLVGVAPRVTPGSCGGCSGRCAGEAARCARAARGALLEDVVVLQSVRPQGLLPHEDEDLHPPGVAELEGLDVVEAYGAVRRQAREVHPRVGQSGLPAPGGSVTAALALGARGSFRGNARTALRPRRPQMRSDSSEVMARIGLS